MRNTLLGKRRTAGRDNNLVADRKTTDALARSTDCTGGFVARHEWRRRFHLILAGDRQHIGKIDTCCCDVNDNFALACNRILLFFYCQRLRRAILVANEGSHQATANNDAAPWPPPTHIVQTTYLAPRRLPSINA